VHLSPEERTPVATPPLAPSSNEPLTPQQELRDSAEFERLRRIFRTFIFPMTVLFLVWYFLYVLMAAFAPDFMATKVVGNINVGLIFGLLQFVSTFAITIAYKNWADKKFDPAAAAIRHDLEAGAR
jgi:uncharacterized membrane protein (DUF485 family)